MLSLLLDENISHEVAAHVLGKRPDIRISSVHYWHGGTYKGRPDELILTVAAQEGMTLLTYDKASILKILEEWGSIGISHAGVLFADKRTISSSDYGGLMRSIISLWDARRAEDWTNVTDFLRKPQ